MNVSRSALRDAVVAALVVAAREGIPADVQELLVHGDVSRHIPPGVLEKMILATLEVWP